MKINPSLIGGALVGGAVAGNTGDDYEAMPTIGGMAVGGTAGHFMNLKLPTGILDPVKVSPDYSKGVSSHRVGKNEFMSDITEILTNFSKGTSSEEAFDPKNPLGSISETNLKSALRYYEQVGETELKKALLYMKEGPDSFVKLNPEALTEGYEVPFHFSTKNESIIERGEKVASHLQVVETINTPAGMVSEAQEANRTARVKELEPLLARLKGNVILNDGNLKSTLNNQTFTLPLTQTLYDGSTLGHVSNNNVYTSHKFNILGSLVAQGLGSTEESAKQVLTNLGIEEGTTAFNTGMEMLHNKNGVTREAVLGFLASSNKVSDGALLDAINSLSEKTQFDEAATSNLLQNKIAQKNGIDSFASVPTYAKTQAGLIDFATTIKHSKGAFGDLSETALRAVKTSTDTSNDPVESHLIRRAMKATGQDRVSSVKADHSLLFSPSEQNLFNLNTAYNRNSGSVTNRALSVKGSSAVDRDFKTIQGFFGETSQFGSAVAINTAVLEEEKVSASIARVFGGNVTLGDGYAIGNKQAFSQYEHEGYRVIKLQGGLDQQVSVRGPLLNNLLDGSLSLPQAKELAEASYNFSTQRSSTILEATKNYALARDFITNMKDPMEFTEIEDVLSKQNKGLARMLTGIYHSFEKEQAASQNVSRADAFLDPDILHSRLARGVETYFDSRILATNFSSNSTEYGDAILEEVNTILQNARDKFKMNDDALMYELEVQKGLKHLDTQKELLRAARQTVHPRGGQTIGYGVDGTAEKLSKSFPNYSLEDINQRVDPEGNVSLELSYKGTANMADNHVVKTFSVNYKDQNVLVDKNTFTRIGALGDMLSAQKLKDNNDGSFTLSKEFSRQGKETTLSAAEVENMLKVHRRVSNKTENPLNKEGLRFLEESVNKYSNVTSIAGVKGAGYGNSTAILEEIAGNSVKESVLPKTIKETIEQFPEALRKNNASVRAGLLDFAYATSNDKPSNTALAENLIRTQESLRQMTHKFSAGHLSFDELLSNVSPMLSEKQLRNATASNIVETINENFARRSEKLAQMMSTAEGLFRLTSSAVERKEVADIFVTNAMVQNKSPLDNTHIGLVAMNRKAITETGAGTFEKSMSWNAQTQLLSNGYTKDHLDMFATFDKAAVNDAQALTGMTRKHDTLLNKMFEENRGVIKTVLGSAPEERRRILEDAFNFNSGNAVDFYNLNYTPESGIKAIPLIYDETRGFDSYVDSVETGTKQTKRINKLLANIVDTDIELKGATDVSEIRGLRNALEGYHKELESAVKPTLSGSSGVAKAALTRVGDASHLGVVGAIQGDLADFISAESVAGRSSSYVGVSYHGALERMKLSGIDFTEKEESEFLKGSSKYLIDVEGSSSLKRIVVNETPFFGFVNREPAQGPMSIRGAEYIVDTSIKDSAGASASVFVPTNDRLYKLLQFGDYDFDSMTEYFPKNGYATNSDMLNEVIAKSRVVAEDYNKLLSFADKLGVKNNKGSSLPSLMDILEKNPELKTYEDWHKAYLDAVYDDTTKAGLRKTISPKVTMLASQLNNSLLLSQGISNSEEVQAGRVLSHYFVENLLKAQHSSGSASGETVAEMLSRLREEAVKGNPGQYFDQLNTSLTEQLKNLSPTSQEFELGQDAIDAILKAERSHLSSQARNPMEIGGQIRGKNLNDSLETISNVLSGEGQGVKLNRLSAETPELAEGFKVGYDRTKSAVKQLYTNNKKVLGIAAAGLAGVSLMFRDTDSYKEPSVTADVGRSSIEAHQNRNPVQGQASSTASEYVTPHRDAKRAVTVEGDYVEDSENASYNTRKSIFGDGIDSAQVEYRE